MELLNVEMVAWKKTKQWAKIGYKAQQTGELVIILCGFLTMSSTFHITSFYSLLDKNKNDIYIYYGSFKLMQSLIIILADNFHQNNNIHQNIEDIASGSSLLATALIGR